jgi:cephalosporin-C deacetylase-like acetyl esterase
VSASDEKRFCLAANIVKRKIPQQTGIAFAMLLPMPTVAIRTLQGVTVMVLWLAGSGGFGFAQAPSPEDIDFLHGLSEYQNIRRMLPNYMERESEALVQSRKQSLDLSTPEALRRRRQFVRERILHAIGGLPERTPLHARTVDSLERDGYRVEKVIFESQPKFYVTANLYLPTTGHPPYPAVLYPLGHELGGKANPTWQQMLATLARRGYVALTWDPLGQGERVQLYSPDLRDSMVGSSTTEHTILGIQCLLTGQHIARYTIWDGIRALDYLLSRKEVDPERVAITGNSGGGTHSAYIAGLDDRIRVAAPSCFITSWHRMLKTLGPQDAEQVFPGWLGDGLDYPDFLYAASPKPYLILSAIRDFFPIDGARETFQEAKHTYSAIGAGQTIDMFEADDGHGYSLPRRMAAYHWLSHELRDRDDTAAEVPVTPESEEVLFCTTTGQVVTSLGGETVFTLNQARAERLRESRLHLADAGAVPAYQEKVRQAANTRTGYKPASGPVPVTPYGTMQRKGYRIEKFTYESEPGIFIPSVLFLPDSGPPRKPVVFIAEGEGKSATITASDRLARAGFIVLSVDLRGMGETQIPPENDSEFYRYFGDYEDGMTSILMNRTLAGMRARDIVRGLDMLSARADVDTDKLSAIGRNGAAVPLLYAALFDKRLKAVALEGMLVSYDAVATTRLQRVIFEQIVPGALIDFDLPDLVSALAPRTVWLSDGATPTHTAVPRAEFVQAYAPALRAFTLAGAPDALRLQHPRPADDRAAEYYRDLVH